MPTMPSRLPWMRWPSMPMGDQPCHLPERIRRSPWVTRRATDRISAMVMSAVSSVRTPGVLVTVMPRCRALARSIWSTPVPKDAMRRRFSPAWARMAASIRSVTVGTSTSAAFTASTSCAWLIGASSRLRRTLNNSAMRVSIASGSFRVTMTSGLDDMETLPLLARRIWPLCGPETGPLLADAIPGMARTCPARGRDSRVTMGLSLPGPSRQAAAFRPVFRAVTATRLDPAATRGLSGS